MKKSKILWMLYGAVLVAGLMLTTSCFKSPTSPSVVTSGGSSGCTDGCVDIDDYLDIDTDSSATGSISGTVSNSSGSVQVIASNATSYFAASLLGDGSYTIDNVPDGTYDVMASDGTSIAYYPNDVTVSGGGAVTGIDLSF